MQKLTFSRIVWSKIIYTFSCRNYLPTKRLMDILVSFILLPFAIPVFSILFVFIALDLREFPIFIQKRHGFKCKTFTMLKLKTMRTQPVGLQISDHLRVTRFTSYIRQLRLDELPQLISILLGHMSFVGPRPLPPHYTKNSSNKLFPLRYNVVPGILGLSQLYGGEMLPFNHRLKIDLIYVRNCSFRLDLLILKKTFLLFFFELLSKSSLQSHKSSLPEFF